MLAASVAIALTATYDQLVSGVGKAGKCLGGLGSAADQAEGKLAKLEAKASKAGASLNAAAAPGLDLGKAIRGLAAGVAAKEVAEFAASTLKGIDATAKLAQRIGTTADEVATLQYAVGRLGGNADEFPKTLEKLGGKIGQALAEPTGEYAKAFQKLELDPATLSGLDRADAFRTLADAIAAVPDPTRRAAMTMKLFEEEGIALTAILSRGSAGIRELQSEARALGVGLDDSAVAKSQEAAAALARLEAAGSALGRNLVVAVAPALTTVAEALAGVAAAAAKVGQGLGRDVKGFEDLPGLREAIDFGGLNFFRAGVGPGLRMKGGAKAKPAPEERPGAAFDAKAVAESGKHLDEFYAKLREQRDTFGLNAREVEIYKMAMEGATEAELAEAFAIDAKISRLEKAAKATEAAKEAQKDLQKQLDTFGMSDAQRRVYELRQAGAPEADVGKAADLAARLDAKAKAKEGREKREAASKSRGEEMDRAAESIREGIKAPLEKYQDKQARIDEAAGTGRITEAEAERARKLAKAEYGRESGLDRGAGGAMERGSAEARSTILAFQNRGEGSGTEDAAKKTERNTGQTARSLSDAVKLLDGIQRKLPELEELQRMPG